MTFEYYLNWYFIVVYVCSFPITTFYVQKWWKEDVAPSVGSPTSEWLEPLFTLIFLVLIAPWLVAMVPAFAVVYLFVEAIDMPGYIKALGLWLCSKVDSLRDIDGNVK